MMFSHVFNLLSNTFYTIFYWCVLIQMTAAVIDAE